MNQECVADPDDNRAAAVAARTVFYIAGYDYRGPGHYHRLYHDEASRQEKVNGLAISVGPLRRVDEVESEWDITTGATRTRYRVLRYDDIVRRRWSRTNFRLLRDIMRYSAAQLRRAVLGRVLRTSWPMFVTMTYAPGFIAAALLLALAAALLVGYLATWYLGLAAGCAVIAMVAALRARLERRFNLFWLARIGGFVTDQGEGLAPDMEARTDLFASRIAESLRADRGAEVLVIGHSVGTQIAVSACARALKAVGGMECKLSLLTLGHTIPLLALQPGAGEFRSEIEFAVKDRRLDWIDVSAATDGACFPLTDPVAGSGLIQPDPAHPKPKLVSARFIKMFTPETYARMRRDFKRTHFQYMMATELRGDYDYFLITAGDRTLSDRFGHLDSVRDFNRFRLGAA